MTDRTATVPAAVTRAYPDLTGHPVIVEVFTPGHGWLTLRGLPVNLDRLVRGTYHKRITPAYARTLGEQGVTRIAVDVGGRAADFTVAELLRRPTPARRPR